jgi:hypothetical protein
MNIKNEIQNNTKQLNCVLNCSQNQTPYESSKKISNNNHIHCEVVNGLVQDLYRL